MNKQETIADIIAEMRALSNSTSDGIIAINGRIIADRLEAAWKHEKVAIEANALAVGGMVEASRKRELSKNCPKTGADFRQLGDAAKMREALKKVAESSAEIMERVRYKDGLAFNTANYIADVARTALAEPPRNCDRFDSFPQAYDEWYKTEVLPRVYGVVDGAEPPFDGWLFLPVTDKKGENNGSK